MLTDVDAIYLDWGKPSQRPVRKASSDVLRQRPFPSGSMGPKVEAACDFVAEKGGLAGIGALDDALRILEGRAGTQVVNGKDLLVFT
jgi:carbamate kinase